MRIYIYSNERYGKQREKMQMLNSIDRESFAGAIQQSYKTMTETSSNNLAAKLIDTLDSSIEGAVTAWIKGDEVPDISFEKYSINKILAVRNSDDYLEAFKLLSEYVKNPVIGEKHIWKPIRCKR